MNKPNNFFLRLHQLAALAFIISAICRAEAKKQRPGFFLFGDSFLDAGNNNYINTTTLDQANFWPYGTTFFHSPTGRFSDGRLLPDFIAKYAKLPLIPPFLRPGNKVNDLVAGVNFASGGAGALVDTFRGDVIDLKTQLGNMKKVNQLLRNKLGKEEAKAIVSSAVYMFSIGSNDYMSPFLTNSSSSSQTSSSILVSMVISNFQLLCFICTLFYTYSVFDLQEIYEMGGRKFVFMNVPTLGCLPAMRLLMNRGSSCSDDRVSELAKLHNAALSMVLPQMGREMKGFKYSLFDFSRSLHRRMTRPSNYGTYYLLIILLIVEDLVRSRAVDESS
ncbi:GDSL esterase/lipase 5 [Linum perenne]